MPKLYVIIASTRPGRKGPSMANWIFDLAKKEGSFEVELVDLKEINLPFMDEPHHPRLQKYEHEHTKAWSKQIEAADAFIFVTPEYNYSYPATLKNAIDFLHSEWAYKPIAFVSYGGVSAGTRSVQAMKQVVAGLKMMPIPESINIPAFTKHIDEHGIFKAEESMDAAAWAMIKELMKWMEAMKPMRAK
jgi:NAD(P)H-dependent FMN reductase